MALRPQRRRPVAFEVLTTGDDDSFLGTLPTEDEVDDEIDGAFAEVYARFVSVRDAYLAGLVDAQTFGLQARDLRVLDEDGLYWTLGATTMRWYAFNPHDATQWIASPAPGKGGVVVDATGRPSGWAVEDWDARRAQRAAERRGAREAEPAPTRSQPDVSYATEAPTAEETGRRRRMTIDEMFGRYVDDGGQRYSVESSVLSVEEDHDESER